MRYAIVSDLHANWQAWSAVRDEIYATGVDAIICLGDVVGYGPSPQRVLADIREHCENFVLGNHDAVMVGRLDLEIFNEVAQRSARWTIPQLSPDSKQALRDWPMLIEDERCTFVHAETVAPDDFGYVNSVEDAQACFVASEKQLIFIGHTHRQTVYVLTPSGEVVEQEPTEVELLADHRYLMNVGSVGDPRDGTDQASYLLLDFESNRAHFRKVAFDGQTFLRELKKYPELQIPWFLQKTGGAKLRLVNDTAMITRQVSKTVLRKASQSAQVTVGASSRQRAQRPLEQTHRIRMPGSSVAPVASPASKPATVDASSSKMANLLIFGLLVLVIATAVLLAVLWWKKSSRPPPPMPTSMLVREWRC